MNCNRKRRLWQQVVVPQQEATPGNRCRLGERRRVLADLKLRSAVKAALCWVWLYCSRHGRYKCAEESTPVATSRVRGMAALGV